MKELFCPQFFLALVVCGSFGYLVYDPHPIVLPKAEEKVVTIPPEVKMSETLDEVDLANEVESMDPVVLFKAGQFDQAKKMALQWVEEPQRRSAPRALMSAGTILLFSDDAKDRWLGETLFERAVKMAPKSAKVRMIYADALNRAGLYEDAAKQFNKALSLSDSSDIQLDAGMNLARIYLIQEKPKEAEAALEKVFAVEPESAMGEELQGLALGQQEKINPGFQKFSSGARKILESEAILNPDLKKLVDRNHGSPDSAINELRNFLDAHPNALRPKADLVLLNLKLDRAMQAKAELDSAISEKPDYPLFHERMAEYAIGIDNQTMAKEEFAKAVSTQKNLVTAAGLAPKYEASQEEIGRQADFDKLADKAREEKSESDGETSEEGSSQ